MRAELSDTLPGLTLSSANSINWGRFLPQIVFTFNSYAQLVQKGVIRVGDEVDVCIPTGNFGNLLGAVYARRLGLPLRRLISASNTNNVLTDFIDTGTYDLRQRRFTATVSPSIDILVSSNLERFLHLLTRRDSAQIARLFGSLASDLHFTVTPDLLRAVQDEVACGWCSEAECLQTIRRVWEETSQVIDPHTAVAVHVATATQRKEAASVLSAHPVLISSTAHYGKFPSTVLHALTGEALSSLPTDMDGLFERLGVSARTEHHHPRVLGVRAGDGSQRLQRPEHGVEEGGQPARTDPAEHLREHLGHHPAVGHRVAGPGRRLRPVGQGQETTLRGAGQVHRVEEELRRAGDPDVMGRAQVVVVPENQLGRYQPAADQRPTAVEVEQDLVEQPGPLHQPRLQHRPVRALDDQRDRVERPPLRRSGRTRGHPDRRVGHTVVLQDPFHQRGEAAQPVRADGGHHLGHQRGVGPGRSGGRLEQPGLGGQPCGHSFHPSVAAREEVSL